MRLTPFNVSLVTAAVRDILLADPKITATIQRSEEINQDPSMCPWIGIYRTRVAYPTRALGFGPGMRNQLIGIMLLLQEADGSSGESCEERLELLIQQVLTTILSDPTLGGVVATLDEVEVQYPDYQRTAGNFLQTAVVYITALGGIQ